MSDVLITAGDHIGRQSQDPVESPVFQIPIQVGGHARAIKNKKHSVVFDRRPLINRSVSYILFFWYENEHCYYYYFYYLCLKLAAPPI